MASSAPAGTASVVRATSCNPSNLRRSAQGIAVVAAGISRTAHGCVTGAGPQASDLGLGLSLTNGQAKHHSNTAPGPPARPAHLSATLGAQAWLNSTARG